MNTSPNWVEWDNIWVILLKEYQPHFHYFGDHHNVFSCVFTSFSILLYFLFTWTYYFFCLYQLCSLLLHFLIQPKDCLGPCSEVGSENLAHSITGIETKNLPTLTVMHCLTLVIGELSWLITSMLNINCAKTWQWVCPTIFGAL